MSHILIVYGTQEGQTAKIASAMQLEIERAGHRCDVYNLQDEPVIDLTIYDGVIAGASVHFSKLPRTFRKWMFCYSKILARKPIGFFSVCLGILETNDPLTVQEEQRISSEFLSSVGLKPMINTIFAGALTYSQYGWFKRLLMKRIAARAGGSADTTQDHEYTNWEDVAKFANRFVCLVQTNRNFDKTFSL